MKRIEFHAMGSRMLTLLDSDLPAAEEAIQLVPEWFEEWEQVLSRFRPDSELSRLNWSAGQTVAVSDTFWDVFQTARWVESYTAGLVRPTVLGALIDSGYDRSFDLLPHAEESSSIASSVFPQPVESSSVIACDERTRCLTLPEEVRLDFGGVAKGWAARKVMQRLRRYGPILMDAGGDIAVSGSDASGNPWPVGIRNPFQPDSYLDVLRLEHGGVATSGTDYHRWFHHGAWNHHLIDPTIGLPARTDVLTATVIAPDTVRAEAAAKTAVIMGSRAGLDYLESDPTLAGLLIMQSGEMIYSKQMQPYLWRTI